MFSEVCDLDLKRKVGSELNLYCRKDKLSLGIEKKRKAASEFLHVNYKNFDSSKPEEHELLANSSR